MVTSIKEYLPERLKQPDQTFNQALIASVDSGADFLIKQIQACIDQFFLTTANGKYLVQLGEQEGFTMPANSGLDIRAYRILVPLMVSSPKQVRRTFEEIIQAFYGADKTRPSVTSVVAEPFSLADGDDLHIQTERGVAIVSILASSVSDISSVTASELAASLNTVQTGLYADTVSDRLTGKRFLRIASTTVGANAFIKIVGGTAQNVLKFPHLIPCEQTVGTTWLLSKSQPYSDELRFHWNGLGPNPKIYLIQKDDCVTVRSAITEINGSYAVIDSGYDYFVVRNSSLDATSATLIQNSADDIVFTSQVGLTIYDNPEYGLAGEVEANTATVTIPAIPPLARRFLSGSAHLHGSQLNVLGFTRNTITFELPNGTDKPLSSNQFVLKNDTMMYDFRKPFYKTEMADSDPTAPTYLVSSADKNYSALPFTQAMFIGETAIHCEVDSSEMVITFPFDHGLDVNWAFTLTGVAPIANLSSSVLNQERISSQVVSSNCIVCNIDSNSSGSLINSTKFLGVLFGSFTVSRYLLNQQDDSDFYITFPSEAALVASGIQIGQTFKIKADSGVPDNVFYLDLLKHRKLEVASINGAVANIKTGLGTGVGGQIASDVSGYRSADFGGPAAAYYFDLTSDWNKNKVLSGMRACLMAYTPSANSAYVGSFVFDPQGVNTALTVSKHIVHATDELLKGSNTGVIFVDKVANIAGGESFPQSGKLVLDYGKDGSEGPINYLAVIDGGDSAFSQIIIDPAYRFKNSHAIGAQVQFVHQVSPYVPSVDGADYPVYVTGTAQARNTLFQLLEDLVAGGVFLQPDVLLPQLRYQDSAIPPFV